MAWYKDIAYPLLHPHLVKMHPGRHLLSPPEALQWRKAFEQKHTEQHKLNKQYSDGVGDATEGVAKIQELKAPLKAFDEKWNPQCTWLNGRCQSLHNLFLDLVLTMLGKLAQKI